MALATVVKYSFLAIVLVIFSPASHTNAASAQNCSAGLGQLTVCAPFVVPGVANGPPSTECCSALAGVDHTCLCNTIDIINRLPSACKLPTVSCSA